MRKSIKIDSLDALGGGFGTTLAPRGAGDRESE